jgi:hypothetical protein
MSEVLDQLEEAQSSAPIARFREAVAEKAKVTDAVVDLVLDDAGVQEETATRRADYLTVRRLVFSGTKSASGYADGPYTFEWKGLGPGLFAALSEGANQLGKSTILEVMLWAMRGHPRSLKAEVRSWIDTVELEFTIGADHYSVSYTDFDAVPRGKLVLLAPGPARILQAFEGDEDFENAMGDLMMERFALQPIPNVSHGGDEASQYFHSWSAYAASMFIEGSHPAILGDVTVGALWWRMLHLFVGMPYAATHMALRNAVTLEQAQRDGAASGKVKQDAYSAELQRAEGEQKRLEERLKTLSAGALRLEEVDAAFMQHTRLTREGSELQARLAEAEKNVAMLRQERDEARAAQRRLEEGAASKRIFAGLKPVCCPRCAEAIPDSRSRTEESVGRCAVCDRDTLKDDQEALKDALAAAAERVETLFAAEDFARKAEEKVVGEALEVQRKRAEAAQKIRAFDQQAAALRARRELEGQLLKLAGAIEQLRALKSQGQPEQPSQERLRILKAAEAIAEARMKSASAGLFHDLQAEVVAIAKRFGFHGLQAIAIRGNGINLTVSGVSSSYSKQTAGQRLRLRIALVIAMMRMADRSGYGNHPGLLFIDSPGSEELSDEDLVAMIKEIGQVTNETRNLQIFLASARGDILAPAIAVGNIRPPIDGGAMF